MDLTNKLPQFPKFKKLELSDADAIRSFTSQFEPYSDFNFVSLWTWNIEDKAEISQLNGNFVIKFNDYVSGEPFLSFLGRSKVATTAKTLINYCKLKKIDTTLQLIPDTTAKMFKSKRWKVEEDRDGFDYVFKLDKMVRMQGKAYFNKRKNINKFRRIHKNYKIKKVNLREAGQVEKLKRISYKWFKNKKGDTAEKQAIERALENFNSLDNVFTYVLSLGSKPITFFIGERINSKNAIGHYIKADYDIKDASNFLTYMVAKNLHDSGCKYVNFEQDLGIEGLRRSKLQWQHDKYLKKYEVCLNDYLP